jgi:Tfp pilus assembly protein PilO
MKLINNIDNYFYAKSDKDTLMIYVMILFLIGFVVFYFLLPQAKKYRDTQKNIYNRTKSQLQSLKTRKNVLNVKIITLNKKIKNLILEKTALKKQKDFYDELANLLDFVEFNKYKWGEFVKELVKNAKKEGLKVEGFTNKLYNDNKSLINKKMEISLKVKGEYKNLLYFIYHYEDLRDLLRIEHIKIEKNKNFEVNFVLYGYEK